MNKFLTINQRVFLTMAGISCYCMLAACSIGPDYKRPKIEVPEAFQDTRPLSDYGVPPQPAPVPATFQVNLSEWWKSFNDPILVKLIDEATAANLDVKLAEARVRETRALLMASRAPFVPDINTYGAFTRNRTSENGIGSNQATSSSTDGSTASSAGTGTSSTTTTTSGGAVQPGVITNLYEGGFDASWEIDIFGQTRREVEAAQDTFEAAVNARRNALVTLLSEVAQNYVRLRGAQNQLDITRQNAAAQRETLDLQRMKLDAGIESDLTVAEAESQLRLTESKLPTLETPIREAINRLSVLIDRNPGALCEELLPQGGVPRGPAQIPAGLPSELLERRPDVHQAENLLAAATANIGAAEGDLFPKLVLNGTFGLRSRDSGELFDASSKFWSLGPRVNWGILDFYAVLSNLDIKDAQQEQALIQYRQVVLGALEEADNAIIAYQREQDQNALLQRSVDASKRTLQLANDLNQAGSIDFINVLSAQQTVFDSQNNLALSDQSMATSLIALYKALGGGWESRST